MTELIPVDDFCSTRDLPKFWLLHTNVALPRLNSKRQRIGI